MIREATTGDVMALVEMGQRFYDDAGQSGLIKQEYHGFDATSFAHTLFHFIEASDKTVLISTNGPPVAMLGLVWFPSFSDYTKRIAQGVFWDVDPEYRGYGLRLLPAAERLMKEHGAELLIMTALESYDIVAKLYEHRGYLPIERNFAKRL